jgi:hypothetical protein
MHDCRKTKESLVELLFSDHDGSRPVQLQEIETCARCRDEFEELSATLGLLDHAARIHQPAESYWPGYTARLAARLQAMQVQPEGVLRWWHRFAGQSIPVPAPLAVALALLLIITTGLAVRGLRADVSVRAAQEATEEKASARQEPAPPPAAVPAPVSQSKGTTRVVYVRRCDDARKAPSTRGPGGEKIASSAAPARKGRLDGRRGDGADDNVVYFTRTSLKGFEPSGNPQIRMIKPGDAYER